MDMKGNKREGGGFCGMQLKKAKTEIAEDKTLFGFMREPPSLQSIASISVAIRLWTQPSVLKMLDDSSQRYRYVNDDDYNAIEKGLKRKLDEMIFPNSLKVNISNLIRPIGLQLELCFLRLNANSSYLYYLYKGMDMIYWTMCGTIDKSRSLKTLINNGNQLYKPADFFDLACEFCLEDCIIDLWVKMPLDKKSEYEDSADFLITYWIFSLTNQSQFLHKIEQTNDLMYNLNCSVHQNMVSLSINASNVYSFKYFRYKLTEEEKVRNLKTWLLLAMELGFMFYSKDSYGQGNDCIDVLCFLLSHLQDHNELKEIFLKDSGDLLKILFLNWPQNQYFLTTLNLMMLFDYLHVNEYDKVIEFMVKNIKKHKIEGKLFRNVWFSSPLKFKESFIKLLTKNLRFYVIEQWDVEIFQVILEFFSSVEKRDIILKMIRYVEKDSYYLEVLKMIYVCVPKELSSDREINLLKVDILLHPRFVYAVINCAGVLVAKQLISFCFPALNEIQKFQKKDINVETVYKILVIIGSKDYVDQFLKWHYDREDEISKFKISVISCPLYKWFYRWSLKCIVPECCERWKIYEGLIHDTFCSPEEIVQFKKDHLGDVIALVQRGDYELALMFLNWFFSSSDDVEVDDMDVNYLYQAFAILGNFDYLNQFLKLYFRAEDAIEHFKRSKLNCSLNEWFSKFQLLYLIPKCDERWKVYKKLIHDSFCSPEEIVQFKKDHLSDVVDLVRKGEFEFTLVFLNWFFVSSGDIVINAANVSRLYEAFVILGDFYYLEQFLKLYFTTEDEIIGFKKSNLDRPLNQWFSEWNLKYLMPQCYERWNVYEKFINYNFRSPEELAQFKEKQVVNAVGFVDQEDSLLASMFINWCFDSKEAVNRFNIYYMMSGDRIADLCEEIKKVKDLILWFSPTPSRVCR